MKAMREGNERANELRAERGLPPMTLVGWEVEPHYDPATNNVEWGLRLSSAEGLVVNYNIRLLGRDGVMSATVVGDPEEFGAALPVARQLLAGRAVSSAAAVGDCWSGPSRRGARGISPPPGR